MQQRTEKRYYEVGETVWVKSEKTIGEIAELTIKPEEKIYEAVVKIVSGNKTTTLQVNLWDIDKNKRTTLKKNQKPVRLVDEKKPTILFAKVKEDAIIPSKSEENAGYDIYACFNGEAIIFAPHETALIPTGIASSVINAYALVAKERGSTGVKGMGIRAGVIDSGYRGEIFIAITNENDKNLVIAKHPEIYEKMDVVVYPASKAIAQLLLTPVPQANVKEISYESLKAISSTRGVGKIGSSGK